MRNWPRQVFIGIVFAVQAKAQLPLSGKAASVTAAKDNDTLQMIRLAQLSESYKDSKPDSALYYSTQFLQVARKLGLRMEEAVAMSEVGYDHMSMGNYPKALADMLAALQIAEDPSIERSVLPPHYPVTSSFFIDNHDPHRSRLERLSDINMKLGVLYDNVKDRPKEMEYKLISRRYADQTGNAVLMSVGDLSLARAYLASNQPDSALFFAKRSLEYSIKSGEQIYYGSILLNLGRIYFANGDIPKAVDYVHQAVIVSGEQHYIRGVVAAKLWLSDYYLHTGHPDSALFYAHATLPDEQKMADPSLELRTNVALANVYQAMNKQDSLVKYQSAIIRLNDSLFNTKQAQQFKNVAFDEEQRRQEAAAEKKAYAAKMRFYVVLAGLVFVLLLAILIWRNYRITRRSMRLVQKQKSETEKQKAKVEQTLDELRSTQARLIRSEKMASLGEITAGIAHEIQNPLNFVNNFSEVSAELLEEAKNELQAGKSSEALLLIQNIQDNLEKIVHHGKRADAIVKEMLQHSRTSTGQREPTDLNKLVDEYLRLSYFGFRHKDKAFAARIDTLPDPELTMISLVPQEMGRVLLNVFNNAFYATAEKRKMLENGYEPCVTVTTRKTADGAEISVRDNGPGVPEKNLNRIFQPFFTTKPPGQGTGLGLSLSYDIIKSYGGDIDVLTQEGVGTEFIISIPLT